MRVFPAWLAWGAFLVLADGSGAQTPAPDDAPAPPAVVAFDPPVQRRLDYLTAHLSLNAAQKALIGPILEATWRDLRQAYAFPGVTTDSKRVKQLRVRARQRISSILTPEQRDAYVGMRNQEGLP